ncbi:MAG: hypothetical protein IJT79_08360 [Ruminococcus sp.]|nr:hypothetical protein [Ruminococcus sp.]
MSITKSIAKIGWAPIFEDTNGNFSYGAVNWLPDVTGGGREISSAPQGETKEIYANGKCVVSVGEKAGYDVTLTLMSLLDDIEVAWLGNKRTTTGGILEASDDKPTPRIALLAAYELFNSDTKYKVETYFYCTAQDPTRSAKTKEKSFDPDFPQYTIKSMPRPDNCYILNTEYVNELPSEIVLPTVVTDSSSGSAQTYTYTEVSNPSGNPSTKNYYELVGGTYVLSEDTSVDSEKTYYTRSGS